MLLKSKVLDMGYYEMLSYLYLLTLMHSVLDFALIVGGEGVE